MQHWLSYLLCLGFAELKLLFQDKKLEMPLHDVFLEERYATNPRKMNYPSTLEKLFAIVGHLCLFVLNYMQQLSKKWIRQYVQETHYLSRFMTFCVGEMLLFSILILIFFPS